MPPPNEDYLRVAEKSINNKNLKAIAVIVLRLHQMRALTIHSPLLIWFAISVYKRVYLLHIVINPRQSLIEMMMMLF